MSETTIEVRRPRKTWDGRKIGHTEPLETERAIRMAVSRRVNLIAVKQAQARTNGAKRKGKR